METKPADFGFTSIRYYKAKRYLTRSETEHLQELIQDQDGIISINLKQDGLSVEFYGHIVSELYIMELLKKGNFPFAPEPRKSRIKRFIENLAETNRKTYGDQRLDCCGLNHAKQSEYK